MKSTKKTNVKITAEIDDSFISPDIRADQKKETLFAFRNYRKKIEAKRSHEEKLNIQLLQLQYSIES